jgi:hypothetical protein
MLSVIYPVQDPASGLFAAFVMAAASAANGRNALALAPSLPGRPLLAVPAEQQPWSGEPPERVAEVVAALSTLIAERLTQPIAPTSQQLAASRNSRKQNPDQHGWRGADSLTEIPQVRVWGGPHEFPRTRRHSAAYRGTSAK